MPRWLLITLALLLAAGCSAREFPDEGESRRHLAAQWCEDWCVFWYDCFPPFMDEQPDGCFESCEADPDWDRTDECGDLTWEFRECSMAMTCQEHLDALEREEHLPCQHIFNEYVLKDCPQ